MKKFIYSFFIFVYFFGNNGSKVLAQQQFTSFDNFPGNIPSYKPTYNERLPEWGRLLYQPQVNFKQVQEGFKSYMALHPAEHSPIIRYYKIWSRSVQAYVSENGNIQPPNQNDYYNKLIETQKHATTNTQQRTASSWSFLGPKETFWLNENGSSTAPNSCPWQVNVYSFDVAPSNSNILFAGTETGYVNKTTDKGLNWQLVAPSYVFGGGITAIAIDPTNPNIVYTAAGNQIHKTIDGGITWLPMLPSNNLFLADRLCIDATNPNKIYAASSNGLFLSTDAGNTWTQKWPSAVYDLEIKTDNPNTVMAISNTGSTFQMIVSEDGGQNFSNLTGFPTNITNSAGAYMASTPANPNMMLVVMLSANDTPFLYKGILSGGTWSWTLLATGQSTQFAMDNWQGYYDLVLAVSPTNENVIMAGTSSLYKSIDGGVNFTLVGGYGGDYSIHPDMQDIKMLPNGETWVSTDGGLNLTTDNFNSQANYFVRINGIVGSDMWGFDQGWNEDLVVGGRYHNGNTAVYEGYGQKALILGGGESPTGWVLQGKSRHAAFDDLGNGWILPQTAEGIPEGRFLFTKYPNMEEYGGRRSNMVFHPNYYGQIYLGQGTGFWRSNDMGVTWDLIYSFSNNVRYLQISNNNPNVMYADVDGEGLYRSADAGISWTLKPSLTAAPNGNLNWRGKHFFVISPYNENVIYACQSNGTWSQDIGKIFKSINGGDTWVDWSGTISEPLKCMVIQPSANNQELVYLFTQSIGYNQAKTYYRNQTMNDWADFSNNYPAGMKVNLALPFYRDSKLRVAGNGGVWESPMEEISFPPIVNPWVEKKQYNCLLDTLYFDDHSILNHSNASWQWAITPSPAYISNANIRNPKVVLGAAGSYTVSLTVTQNGQSYNKTISNMVSTTTCPSINDCNNPGEVPKSQWSLISVDSQEPNDPGLAVMSFDNDFSTIWHTAWTTGDDPYPHEIQIDMADTFTISKFTYYTRQDGENGRIKDYELYISNDLLNWGLAANSGSFINTSAPQEIVFTVPVVGRYFRLVALNGDVNGNPWASASEFSVVGCMPNTSNIYENKLPKDLFAFPIPANQFVNIELPKGKNYTYTIINDQGKLFEKNKIQNNNGIVSIDLKTLLPGVYFINLVSDSGSSYRSKIIKM